MMPFKFLSIMLFTLLEYQIYKELQMSYQDLFDFQQPVEKQANRWVFSSLVTLLTEGNDENYHMLSHSQDVDLNEENNIFRKSQSQPIDCNPFQKQIISEPSDQERQPWQEQDPQDKHDSQSNQKIWVRSKNTQKGIQSLQSAKIKKYQKIVRFQAAYLSRKQRVERYLLKKSRRVQISSKIKYKKRKIVAEKRLRVKGRFVKKEANQIKINNIIQQAKQ